jgi:hypothetical protein
MSVGLVAPLAATILVLALAVVFARLWVDDARSRLPRELYPLGSRAGRTGKPGGTWAVRAARVRGHVVILAILAIAAWIAVVTSLDSAR